MYIPKFSGCLGVLLLMPMLAWAAELAPTPKPISTNSAGTNQVLSMDEAKRALAHAQEQKTGSGAGTWRYLLVRVDWNASGTNVSYITNVFYEWHKPDGRVGRRIESFDSRASSGSRVQVKNAEGSWELYDQVAILLPTSPTNNGTGIVNTTGGYNWYLGEIPCDDSDPKLAADVQINGERFQEAGHWFLSVTTRHGEKSKVEYTRRLNKKVPLLLRPLLKTADLRKVVDEGIPVRYEWVLDPSSFTVLVRRAFNSYGWLIYEIQGWQPAEDLPPEKYAVPPALKRIRPKSAEEAQRLRDQLLPSHP